MNKKNSKDLYVVGTTNVKSSYKCVVCDRGGVPCCRLLRSVLNAIIMLNDVIELTLVTKNSYVFDIDCLEK